MTSQKHILKMYFLKKEQMFHVTNCVLQAGLMFWPFAQAINFAFVPYHYKTAVYMPACSFLWVNFLCFEKDKVAGSHKGFQLSMRNQNTAILQLLKVVETIVHFMS